MTRPGADLSKYMGSLSGMIVGGNGRGGSGTIVTLEDGSTALLTAKHVVIECIRNTGRIAIGAPLSGLGLQIPRLVRIDSSQQGDAAYLVFPDLPHKIPSLAFDEWTVRNPHIAIGQWTFACGFPGAKKAYEGNQVSFAPHYIGDKILRLGDATVTTGIHETADGIPTSFQGMSGGGLFSDSGEFLGVIIGERRNVILNRGELHSLLPPSFKELYTKFKLPPDAPKGGFLGMKRTVVMDMIDPATSKVIATIGVLAEVLRSKTDTHHQFGRFGRLLSLEIIIPGAEQHWPLNIESLFFFSEDTDKAIELAIQEEFKFLLLRIGWLMRDSDSGESKIQINPPI